MSEVSTDPRYKLEHEPSVWVLEQTDVFMDEYGWPTRTELAHLLQWAREQERARIVDLIQNAYPSNRVAKDILQEIKR